MTTKHQRQHRIARLLETSAVASQAELVDKLREQGVEATQATVSRDLEELGAVKVRLPGGIWPMRYRSSRRNRWHPKTTFGESSVTGSSRWTCRSISSFSAPRRARPMS